MLPTITILARKDRTEAAFALIFNFFVNRNWKKLTDSRKRAKILADNRKSHHSIETLSFLPTNKTFEGICLARAGKFLQKVSCDSFCKKDY